MNASIANWKGTGHMVKHQVLTDLILVMTFQFSVFATEVYLQLLSSIHGCQLVLNSLWQASALKYFMRFFYIKLQNLSTQKCNNFLVFNHNLEMLLPRSRIIYISSVFQI